MNQIEKEMIQTFQERIAEFMAGYQSHSTLEDYTYNYCKVHNLISKLASRIRLEELSGKTREEIYEDLKEVRNIMRDSPFLIRFQTWPRGFLGDYETIEYLWSAINKAPYNTFGYFIEEYSLRTPIAQQHRNKVKHQADLILNSILSGKTKILSIGAGGNLDVRLILSLINNQSFSLVINDMDNEAIEFSKKELASLGTKCVFVNENIIRGTGVSAYAPYDLVITGGVFDYLADKAIILLLKKFRESLLKAGGRFFFTNVKKGNGNRIEIEYFGSWILTERSDEDIYRLCTQAGYNMNEINIQLDNTGFTYLVALTKS